VVWEDDLLLDLFLQIMFRVLQFTEVQDWEANLSHSQVVSCSP